MAEPYIIMMQVKETKKVKDLDVATKVTVELQRTAKDLRSRDRIVKKSEKNSLYEAMDISAIWLERALAGKWWFLQYYKDAKRLDRSLMKAVSMMIKIDAAFQIAPDLTNLMRNKFARCCSKVPYIWKCPAELVRDPRNEHPE